MGYIFIIDIINDLISVPGLVLAEPLGRPTIVVFHQDHPAVGQEEVDGFSHAQQIYLTEGGGGGGLVSSNPI